MLALASFTTVTFPVGAGAFDLQLQQAHAALLRQQQQVAALFAHNQRTACSITRLYTASVHFAFYPLLNRVTQGGEVGRHRLSPGEPADTGVPRCHDHAHTRLTLLIMHFIPALCRHRRHGA